MLIKKNVGIYLERDEIRPLASDAIGDYWGLDCQGMLRNVAGERLTRFFTEATRPEGRSGRVLFSLWRGRREVASRSVTAEPASLPRREVEEFLAAMEFFQTFTLSDNKQMRDVVRSFQIPDPQLQPECYRVYGPFWRRRLLLLWGFSYFDGGGQTPATASTILAEKLRPLINPRHGWHVAAGFVIRLLLLLFLLAAGYGLWQVGKAELRRVQAVSACQRHCPICRQVIKRGLCPNTCPQCLHHQTDGKCDICLALPPELGLQVFPVTPLQLDEVVTFRASRAGSLRLDQRLHQLLPGEQVHCRFKKPGHYYVSWPENDDLVMPFDFLIRVEGTMDADDADDEANAAPEETALTEPLAELAVLPAKVAVDETVLVKDLSWPGDNGRWRQRTLHWGDGSEEVFAKDGILSHAYQKTGHYQLILTVIDEKGRTATAVSTVQVYQDNFSQEENDFLPPMLTLVPEQATLGMTVTALDRSTLMPGGNVRRDVRWGREAQFKLITGLASNKEFYREGVYEVTMRVLQCDGRVRHETRNVAVKQSDWLVSLALEPNPVLPGQTLKAEDISIFPAGREIRQRAIRWSLDSVYEVLEGSQAMHVYEHPDEQHIVILRLIDDLGRTHYGRAGVTVLEMPCIMAKLAVSAETIHAGQAVRLYDLSRSGADCRKQKSEYRTQAGGSWRDFSAEGNALLKFDDPGEYEIGLRVTCQHLQRQEDVKMLTVLPGKQLPPVPEDADFIIVGPVQEQTETTDINAVKVGFEVRRKRQAQVTNEDFQVVSFTVGGRTPLQQEKHAAVFAIAAGGVYEVTATVQYKSNNGEVRQKKIWAPAVEPVLKVAPVVPENE